jgi:hypothetical protein
MEQDIIYVYIIYFLVTIKYYQKTPTYFSYNRPLKGVINVRNMSGPQSCLIGTRK